jgi:L-threonylcarbamoyladenylate synthase
MTQKKNIYPVAPAEAGAQVLKQRNPDFGFGSTFLDFARNKPLTTGCRNDIIIEILKSGGIGIFPTDTIYGIVGSALRPEAVERIYFWRKRDSRKPPIILVSSARDMKKFCVVIDAETKKILSRVWPGKVSVILPMAPRGKKAFEKFKHLHRGTKTLAFRVPKLAWLRKLLRETGPLIAPSANFEGKPPALTIRAAKKYFGKNVGFYADAGRLVSKPSTLIKIEKGRVTVVREGAVKIDSVL